MKKWSQLYEKVIVAITKMIRPLEEKQNDDCKNTYLENEWCVKPLYENIYDCLWFFLIVCKLSKVQDRFI